MNIIIPFKASYIKILILFLFFISSFYFNKPSYGKYASIIMNEKSATNLCSGIDEVAIYDYALEGTAIYTHSQDALVKKMKLN